VGLACIWVARTTFLLINTIIYVLLGLLFFSWLGFILLIGFLANLHLKDKKELFHQNESLTAAMVARNTSEYYGLKDQAVRSQIQRTTNSMQSTEDSEFYDITDSTDLVPIEELDESDFSLMQRTRDEARIGE
jgi:sensor histidine kinase regulating citrate/malate metabolism